MSKPTLEQIRRVRILDIILTYRGWSGPGRKISKEEFVSTQEIGRLLNWFYIDQSKGAGSNPQNWIVSEQTISKVLKKLVKEGILTRESREIPGLKGPAHKFYAVKKDYETLYKVLKEYYNPNFKSEFSLTLGINLLRSQYGKGLITSDLVNMVLNEFELDLNVEKIKAILRMFNVSPYALFSTLETVNEFKSTYEKLNKENREKSLFFTLVQSLGREISSPVFSSIPMIEYEVKVKFLRAKITDEENMKYPYPEVSLEDNMIKVNKSSYTYAVSYINLHPPFKGDTDGLPEGFVLR